MIESSPDLSYRRYHSSQSYSANQLLRLGRSFTTWFRSHNSNLLGENVNKKTEAETLVELQKISAGENVTSDFRFFTSTSKDLSENKRIQFKEIIQMLAMEQEQMDIDKETEAETLVVELQEIPISEKIAVDLKFFVPIDSDLSENGRIQIKEMIRIFATEHMEKISLDQKPYFVDWDERGEDEGFVQAESISALLKKYNLTKYNVTVKILIRKLDSAAFPVLTGEENG